MQGIKGLEFQEIDEIILQRTEICDFVADYHKFLKFLG